MSDGSSTPLQLDGSTASRYARAGLANVAREYPNHPGYLLTGPDDLRPPSEFHPIFFGSYDWHSSVHQHWMLVRLLRRFPSLPEAAEIRHWFDERVTSGNAEVEAAYLRDPAHRAWERPYGWAWLFTLAAELHGWARSRPDEEEDVDRWHAALRPLVEVVRERSLEWLRTSPYPHRAGAHANSAFGAVLLHDAATSTADHELTGAVVDAATRWYAKDAGYAAWVEPSASDFLSPALVEADLMTRVLGREAFAAWFHAFLPDPRPLTEPAHVHDRSDPQIVHLDGLNLSRAWGWLRIGRALGQADPLNPVATEAAARHAAASLPAVLSGEYVGEHWLPTFAVHLVDIAEAT